MRGKWKGMMGEEEKVGDDEGKAGDEGKSVSYVSLQRKMSEDGVVGKMEVNGVS